MVVPTTSVRRNSPCTSEITNKAFENGLLASHWFKIKLQQTVVSATYVYLGRRSTSEIYSDENFEDQHYEYCIYPTKKVPDLPSLHPTSSNITYLKC
jgi:hypothetical protein